MSKNLALILRLCTENVLFLARFLQIFLASYLALVRFLQDLARARNVDVSVFLLILQDLALLYVTSYLCDKIQALKLLVPVPRSITEGEHPNLCRSKVINI